MLVETRGRKDSNKIHNREFHLKINKKKKKKKKNRKHWFTIIMIINYDITKKNISYIFHFFFLHIFFFFTWSNPHAVLCYKAEAQASFCSTKGERDWMSDSQRTRGLAAFFWGGGYFFSSFFSDIIFFHLLSMINAFLERM